MHGFEGPPVIPWTRFFLVWSTNKPNFVTKFFAMSVSSHPGSGQIGMVVAFGDSINMPFLQTIGSMRHPSMLGSLEQSSFTSLDRILRATTFSTVTLPDFADSVFFSGGRQLHGGHIYCNDYTSRCNSYQTCLVCGQPTFPCICNIFRVGVGAPGRLPVLHPRLWLVLFRTLFFVVAIDQQTFSSIRSICPFCRCLFFNVNKFISLIFALSIVVSNHKSSFNITR